MILRMIHNHTLLTFQLGIDSLQKTWVRLGNSDAWVRLLRDQSLLIVLPVQMYLALALRSAAEYIQIPKKLSHWKAINSMAYARKIAPPSPDSSVVLMIQTVMKKIFIVFFIVSPFSSSYYASDHRNTYLGK